MTPYASRKVKKQSIKRKYWTPQKRLERIALAGGNLPTRWRNFYHIADLVIVPSQVEEAFCMVAVVAMAAGKAVLASKKGGISEFVLDGITGYHRRNLCRAYQYTTILTVRLLIAKRHQIAEKANPLGVFKIQLGNVAQRFEEQMKSWFDK